jgi:hypothetical protein
MLNHSPDDDAVAVNGTGALPAFRTSTFKICGSGGVTALGIRKVRPDGFVVKVPFPAPTKSHTVAQTPAVPEFATSCAV